MFNYKCKSHLERSPDNLSDALCIIEYDNHIKRAFDRIIPNKEASTILPIIISQVRPGSIIHTDEHKSYKKLNNLEFEHGIVCHKYNFVNKCTGAHTQEV